MVSSILSLLSLPLSTIVIVISIIRNSHSGSSSDRNSLASNEGIVLIYILFVDIQTLETWISWWLMVQLEWSWLLTPDGAINTNTNTFLLASPQRVHTANKKWRSQNTQGWNTASNILNPWHWSLNCGSDPEQCQSIKFSGCEAAADMEATIDDVHKNCAALSVAIGALI